MSELGKDSLEKAAGEGITLEFKGKTYDINPFTLGDFAALRKYIKSQRIQEFVDAAKDLPTEERQKIILDLASLPVTDELLLEESASLSGITFLSTRSLKQANPDLTDEDINEIITDQILGDNKDLLAVLGGLNGGEESENPPKAEEKQ